MPSITKALPVEHGGYWIRRFKYKRAFPPRRVAPRTSGPQSMAVALRRLAATFGYSPHPHCVQSLFPLRFGNKGDAPTVHPEFQQWHNGGGSFHTFACIDPTVFIEFGAVVHSKSVVGESCHWTSLLGNQPKLGDDLIFNSTLPFGEIQLRDHATIDNLVQIGHNVVVAKNCILCGQVGIAGSVTHDITGPGDNGGFPAVHLHEWRRQLDKLQITVGHTKSGT
ncbi:hypothetical protein PS1_005116 [Malus domestica]